MEAKANYTAQRRMLLKKRLPMRTGTAGQEKGISGLCGSCGSTLRQDRQALRTRK